MKTNQKDLAESLFETYNNLNEVDKRNAEKLFPGLFKSEDEKIIEECIGAVNIAFADGDVKRKCIDYLEKQKESLHIQETCKENTDSFTDESEDERIRKALYNYFHHGESMPFDTGIILTYLERQKERDLDIVPELRSTAWGEGYQRGRKDTEEKYKGMMVCSPEEWNEAIADAFKHGMDEGEKQKEQKPTESGVTNNESDYDKGYREGHKFGLKQNEEYMLPGGRTFSGLIPCWVDAPSTLQPAHKHHGKNLIVMHENNGGFRCCCIDTEKPVTFHLPEDTHLVEGWNKKPSEWNSEDEQNLNVCLSYIKDEPLRSWLKDAIHVRYVKPAEWGEEDNIGWNEAFACVTRAEKAAKNEEELQNAVTAEKWLKEIKFKYYVHPTKQEWSEEDEKMLEIVIANYEYMFDKLRKGDDSDGIADHILVMDWLKSLGPVKQKWSEEDEKMIDLICSCLYAESDEREKIQKFLKSLRPQPKQEWNEEDEKIITDACEQLNCYAKSYHNAGNDTRAKEVYEVAEKLKSLHPVKQEWSEEDKKTLNCARYWLNNSLEARNALDISTQSCELSVGGVIKRLDAILSCLTQPHWKPSEDQMKALEQAKISAETGNFFRSYDLSSLYDDLLKLK